MFSYMAGESCRPLGAVRVELDGLIYSSAYGRC